MHIDARKIPNNSIINGDICIIGAGTAGISMALDWMSTNKKVILLESGGFEYNEDVQDLGGGKTTGQKYYPLKSSRLRFFGGTTGHWAGMCSNFDEIDFEARDWVPHSGWIINKKDLDPFYSKAHKTLELGPYEFDLAYWQNKLPDLIPFPLDEDVVWNKMWQFTTADFNGLYKDEITKARNIHLYTHASVSNISTDEQVSKIKEVIIKNHEGKTHVVRCKHFVLACGAIQNARLLLASNEQAPEGLGNQYDQVGRYFMEHLEIKTGELWLFDKLSSKLYDWKYSKTKARAELAITSGVQRENQILNGTVSLTPLSFARHLKPRIDIWQNEDPRESGKIFTEVRKEAADKAKSDDSGAMSYAYQMDIRIEQAPNPNSRVSLSNEKDKLGVPRANLNWELTSLDKKSIRTINKILSNQFGKANIGRVKLMEFLWDENDNSWPEGTNGGWHHMGTTRMSDNPQEGVVDANCRVHGISNLHVAGSGCFTTSGACNPTLTLLALSLRLSDHLKKQV